MEDFQRYRELLLFLQNAEVREVFRRGTNGAIVCSNYFFSLNSYNEKTEQNDRYKKSSDKYKSIFPVKKISIRSMFLQT